MAKKTLLILRCWRKQMNNKTKQLYYETRTGFQIIGALLKDNALLKSNDYYLSHDDFLLDFHKGIFTCIYNLFVDGVESITPIEIEAYLSRISPRYYKIVFEDNDGIEWMNEATEHASLANFDYNYNRLKKLSLLRDMINSGIDVSDILDLTEIDNGVIEEQNKNFDNMNLNELIKHYEGKIVSIRGKYDNHVEGDYKRAGEGAEKTIQRLKNGEAFGLLGISGFKNRIVYGARRKKFHLCSSGTGGGKSRTALSEIATLVAIELWDYEQEKFVINPNNPKGELSGIYVGTEMALDTEVDVILWAIVSGLETSQIIEMDLTEEEEERLNYAIEIIKKSKIHLYDKPNYDICTLENLVKKHQIDEDIYVLGIDYILLTGNLVMEAKEYSRGMYTREDQLYLYISKSFKERLANALNLYVTSSTQLNRSKNDKNAEKNEGMIRGSFALCDKVDMGSLILDIENYEKEKIVEVMKKQGFNAIQPTHVEHIFKNRGGKLKQVRIFRHINLGNMKTKDLFVTDWDYKLIDIEQVMPEPYVEIIEEPAW